MRELDSRYPLQNFMTESHCAGPVTFIHLGRLGPMVYGVLRSAVYRENGVRVPVGSHREHEMCKKCLKITNDIFWWQKFENSEMSVTKFVNEIYPYNRASFYKMKSRLQNNS